MSSDREPSSSARDGHAVTVTENGYIAACGTEVLVDELGYHCEHVTQMAFADVVEMEPANNLPPNVR